MPITFLTFDPGLRTRNGRYTIDDRGEVLPWPAQARSVVSQMDATERLLVFGLTAMALAAPECYLLTEVDMSLRGIVNAVAAVRGFLPLALGSAAIGSSVGSMVTGTPVSGDVLEFYKSALGVGDSSIAGTALKEYSHAFEPAAERSRGLGIDVGTGLLESFQEKLMSVPAAVAPNIPGAQGLESMKQERRREADYGGAASEDTTNFEAVLKAIELTRGFSE